MKKIPALLLIVLSFSFSQAQKPVDKLFEQRLETYLQLNRELKFEALMEYVHPSLFKLADKKQLVQVFKNTYDNGQIRILIDSTLITAISADFKNDSALYRKIDYRMSLRLFIKDTAALSDQGYVTRLGESLKLGFPNGDIRFNKSERIFEIAAPSIMFAIRDNPASPWMFLGFQKNEAFIKALYPPAVIEHFHLL
jgi:hypothetical protein